MTVMQSIVLEQGRIVEILKKLSGDIPLRTLNGRWTR